MRCRSAACPPPEASGNELPRSAARISNLDAILWRTTFRERLHARVRRVLRFLRNAYATSRAVSPGPAAVLTYHSVAAAGEAEWIVPGNRMEIEIFKRHLEFLGKHRTVLRLGELVPQQA